MHRLLSFHDTSKLILLMKSTPQRKHRLVVSHATIHRYPRRTCVGLTTAGFYAPNILELGVVSSANDIRADTS